MIAMISPLPPTSLVSTKDTLKTDSRTSGIKVFIQQSYLVTKEQEITISPKVWSRVTPDSLAHGP